MLGVLLVWAFAPETFPSELELDPMFGAAARFDELDEADDHEHLLQGYVFPGLVELDRLDWTIEAYGLQGAVGEFTTEARLRAEGEIAHPFDTEIRGLTLAVGLFPPAGARAAYDRLTRPPLQVTQAELDTPLVQPLASLATGELVIDRIGPAAEIDADFREDLGEVTMSFTHMPVYLLAVDSYQLVDPTPADVERILRGGGTADHLALTRWAEEHRDSGVDFDPEDESAIMQLVRERFGQLRTPPALGDFHRLGALDALIHLFGGPEDLEPLLRLERVIKILHTSALLSYDLANRDEMYLGLPVHGMRELPSRSMLLEAPGLALKSLRAPALARLLRLAFDPVDFRDAPPQMRKGTSELLEQATSLLDPLSPTDVSGVLKATMENVDSQREVLRYYIAVHHAPVVEHLVEWLAQHPEAIDDLGWMALRELPEAMLPSLLHHYVDPQDPSYRPLMRAMLLRIPAPLVPQVLQMLRSIGLELALSDGTPHDQLSQALDQFEAAERELASERVVALRQQLREAGVESSTLRSSVLAAARLAQLDPAALQAEADAVFEILAATAMEFDVESPAERTIALNHLENLPWGERKDDAARTLAVTEAKLEHRRGDLNAALTRLERHDPDLRHPGVRSLYRELFFEELARQVEGKQFQAAAKTIDRGAAKIPDALNVDHLRTELLWEQYKPAFLLGGAFVLALLSTLGWLVARSGRALVESWRGYRHGRDRLVRRRADAEANAEDAADFSEEDPEDPTTAFVDAAAPIELPLELEDPPTPVEAVPDPLPAFDPSTRIEAASPLDPPAPVELISVGPSAPAEPKIEAAFADPLGDPFGEGIGDDPFTDEFGWSEELPRDGSL